MISGAAIILLFIGWFYIEKLGVLEPISEEKTIAEPVKTSGSSINEEVNNGESKLERIDSQGTVAIQATLLPEKSTSNQLYFKVAMNTHSGDLLQFELDKLAKIAFGSTINMSGGFEWELTSQDSHHVVGYLIWNGKVESESITLKLENIDDIPSRTFIWEKNDLTQIVQN